MHQEEKEEPERETGMGQPAREAFFKKASLEEDIHQKYFKEGHELGTEKGPAQAGNSRPYPLRNRYPPGPGTNGASKPGLYLVTQSDPEKDQDAVKADFKKHGCFPKGLLRVSK
jgi:hypothetical protein